MIESDSPIYQTLLGTLFTWGMTAAGAGLVVVISGTQVWSVNLDDSFKLRRTIQAALLTLKKLTNLFEGWWMLRTVIQNIVYHNILYLLQYFYDRPTCMYSQSRLAICPGFSVMSRSPGRFTVRPGKYQLCFCLVIQYVGLL